MPKLTVDLLEEARRIVEERIPSIEEAQDELVERLEEEYEGYEDVPSDYRQTYEEFDAERVEARGQALALVRECLAWDAGGEAVDHGAMDGHGSVSDLVEEEGIPTGAAPSEVVIESLTTGQLASVQDRVAEKSFDFDVQTGDAEGTPKSGYGMVETLREAVVSQPPGAPTRKDPDDPRSEAPEPAEYDQQVGMFLYDKVNSLSTTGEADLGNSSLRERMS